MAQNKFNFTPERLRKLQPVPGKQRSYYYDSKASGLRLQITATGTKSFQFQTWDRERKKPATRTLGKFPALSINDARKKATKEMGNVKDGIDIESESKKAREADNLNTIFEMWLEQFAKPHKRTWDELP